MQTFHDKVCHLGVQVQSGVISVDTVIAVRVEIGVKLLIGTNERIGHLGRVLKMDIIIAQSVYQ